jgi:acetolactate synthase I/II/III large subunit
VAVMRVADVIAELLAAHGIRHVFMVTGGAAMHLNDAFGRHPALEYVACHHEQACAMAAESYFRMTGRLAAVNVTAGPGGTNAITGVFGAWVDSLGMLVISGQAKWETLVRSTDLPLRQLGDQEVDIVRLVSSITKYAVVVTDPSDVRHHMERAIHLAGSGRPGPVWLDVPMNVQGALVDPAALRAYDPAEDAETVATNVRGSCREMLRRLAVSERPVILAGTGVRIAGAYEAFLDAVSRLGVPVTTAWNAHDLVWDDHPLYAGRPGSVGDRAGNFAVQNADFLLVLGCRLNIRQIGYSWQHFARAAYKVVVDVDAAELRKPTVRVDLPIHADLAELFEALRLEPRPAPNEAHRRYAAWCLERRERYPVVLPEYRSPRERVNPYVFVESLFAELVESDMVVTGDGTACVCTFQAARIRKGQRLYTNSGSAPMGYDLPAAIGASIATGRRRVVCIAGDGSIQMNVQELATIAAHRLPIKIFVLENSGYHSIRQTQQNYFPDNIVGCGPDSGLGFPDFGMLAAAYGIPFRRVSRREELEEAVRTTLGEDGPQMCEVPLDIGQAFAPKLASRKLADGRMVSSPLEDMAPFLSREELRESMLIPEVET